MKIGKEMKASVSCEIAHENPINDINTEVTDVPQYSMSHLNAFVRGRGLLSAREVSFRSRICPGSKKRLATSAFTI